MKFVKIINKLKSLDFLFPTSKNALIAAKAAGFLDDQEAYWEVFDALEHALFVNKKDIPEIELIEAVIKNTTLNFTDWKKRFESNRPKRISTVDRSAASRY